MLWLHVQIGLQSEPSANMLCDGTMISKNRLGNNDLSFSVNLIFGDFPMRMDALTVMFLLSCTSMMANSHCFNPELGL